MSVRTLPFSSDFCFLQSSYPIANLSLFGSSLEQYKQPVSAFDGLEANAEINEYVQYERMADRPAWVSLELVLSGYTYFAMVPYRAVPH